MAEPVTLPRDFIDQVVAHSREDEPNECCGVIARYADGSLKLYRATNAEASPYRFSIPPGELHYLYRTIEENDGEVFVVYHSHTMSEARPSPTDANFSRMLEGPDDWPYWLLVSLADEANGSESSERSRWHQAKVEALVSISRRFVARLIRRPLRPDWPSVRIWQMSDGEASELELVAGDLPADSSMVQLATSGEERKPVVSETAIT